MTYVDDNITITTDNEKLCKEVFTTISVGHPVDYRWTTYFGCVWVHCGGRNVPSIIIIVSLSTDRIWFKSRINSFQ
jgi:hypothetical protein